MVQVTELGYIGIGVKSLTEWKRFAAEILALEVVEGETPGRCYLRADNWHHRIIVDVLNMPIRILLSGSGK